jgi:hypothetical protein
MTAVVVNRIRLKVPADEVLVDIEREIPPVIRALPGFERLTVAKTGGQEVTVIIEWATVADAVNGGNVIGPGLFNTWVAPRAESQDRVVGEVAIDTVGP